MAISRHPNVAVHFVLTLFICVAGIAAGVWVNLKILEKRLTFEETPSLRLALEPPVEEGDRFSVAFTFENSRSMSLPQDFFFFDLYINDAPVAEFSPTDKLPPKQDIQGTFSVPKENLTPGKHILTLLVRYNPARSRPYPNPVHHVASIKVEIPESEVSDE